MKLGMPLDIIDMVSVVNPGSDNPYHGTQHLYTVALRCFEGGQVHGYSEKNLRELTLAGLFHDYAHPLHTDDEVNLSEAVKGWYKLGEPYGVDASSGTIERLIWATKFPHSHPVDMLEAIIQDADMMQSLEPDREVFYQGLSMESGKAMDEESSVSFMQSQKIHTEWARGLIGDWVRSVGQRKNSLTSS